MQHRCDDCGSSFFVPGQNQPSVIQGGCPECGGNARPEPDQPSPTRGDGELRDMVSPWTGDDQGGNPLQEGILGQTDGGWAPEHKRDESFASVRNSAHGLIPCPDCGGDIKYTRSWDGQAPGAYQCEGCRRRWPDNDATHMELVPGHGPCPNCGSETTSSYNHSPLYGEGASQCHDCGHRWSLGSNSPDSYTDPDEGQSDLTMPDHWGRALTAMRAAGEWMIPMHSPDRASNQTPQGPWEFEVDEVAPPGMKNEDAEEKMEDKNSFWQLAPLAIGMAARGLAGAAAGAGAEGAASGGIMGALRGAAPGLMGRAMGGAMANTPDFGADITQTPPDEAAPMETIASGPDMPGGGTPRDFPKDTEDPEHVDPKEHNDGDTSGTSNDISVNDIGGSATPGLEAMEMMLPLVLHYHDSDAPGSEHPLMVALHQLLTDEGHMDGPDDPAAVERLIRMIKGDSEADKPENSLPSSDGPAAGSSRDEINQPAKTAAAFGAQDVNCLKCGQPTMIEDEGECRNCGYNVGYDGGEILDGHDNRGWYDENHTRGLESPVFDGMTPHQGANHQGPHSPEQEAAVEQYLMDNGRGDEAPTVSLHPWDYAREMAEVSHQVNQPPQDTGAQPIPPPQEEAPPENTMPMPGMTAPPPGQFAPTSRTAAPESINLEPNWDGMRRWILNMAATDLTNALKINREMGSEALSEQELIAANSRDVNSAPMQWSDPHNSHDHAADPLQGMPAADQLQQEDRSQEQDSSGAWQTEDGQPLIVGEQYEMHTPGVDIPDIVTVQAVKPDSVRLEFTGAYELGFAKEITRDEFEIRGYSFSHVRGDQPEANSPVEEQQPVEPDSSAFSGPGNAASGHNVMTSWQVTSTEGLTWDQPGLAPMQPGAPIDPTDIAHQESEWAKTCPTCDSETTQRTGPYHRYCTDCGNTFTPFVDEVDEHTINDQLRGNHPVVGPDGPMGLLPGAIPRRHGAMPGAPGGTASGGVCAQCGGPLQGDGSCAGCERSAVAPGAPGVPQVPSVPQGPNGGRPSAPMEPGGANPSRPPQSTPPVRAYGAVHDPETGQVLDDDAQRLIARLIHNASIDDSPRTAGAHYSPNEQRDLIDETGEARNADKLDLTGTHYPQHTSLADDYMFGL